MRSRAAQHHNSAPETNRWPTDANPDGRLDLHRLADPRDALHSDPTDPPGLVPVATDGPGLRGTCRIGPWTIAGRWYPGLARPVTGSCHESEGEGTRSLGRVNRTKTSSAMTRGREATVVKARASLGWRYPVPRGGCLGLPTCGTCGIRPAARRALAMICGRHQSPVAGNIRPVTHRSERETCGQ